MFDATYPPAASATISPRPAPLDTRALLPMLRIQAAEVPLECLAHAAGGNAVSTARWLALKSGVDADLRDPCHPARSAALDAESTGAEARRRPGSPTYRLLSISRHNKR